MSIIAELKQVRREKEELKNRLQEMESDVALFASNLMEFWQLLGLAKNEPEQNPEDERKEVSKLEVVKAIAKVGKDLTFGKLKFSDITDKWDAVTPLFSKYNHLISKTDV